MVTFKGDQLQIFKEFFLNLQLPKYEGLEIEQFKNNLGNLEFDIEGAMMIDNIPVNFIHPDDMLAIFAINPYNPPRIKLEKYHKLEVLLNKLNDILRPPKNPIELFAEIKSIKSEIEEDVDKIIEESYLKKIEDFEKSGQKDAHFKMKNEYQVYLNEQVLFENGIKEYITEEQMIEVYRVSPRLLRLDWLKTFIRPIPEKVIERKTFADSLKIFDNYVVLHYDPFKSGTWLGPKDSSTKAVRETEQEVQKAKDPILFGVFQGSNRLYYIEDWIDEYCNLTFEQLKGMTKTEYIEKNTHKKIEHEMSEDMKKLVKKLKL